MIESTAGYDQSRRPSLTYWCEGSPCCDAEWERAYTRFESKEQAVRKSLRRFRELGVSSWPRDTRIVELFCGRGTGLVALARLNFVNLEGVDLAPTLLSQYDGGATLYVGDCRRLEFEDASKDAVVIQGGLHHLGRLPDDVVLVLAECRRVLTPSGRLLVVEPWKTPFLQLVLQMMRHRWLRRCWPRLDALARMEERERETYRRWLCQPDLVMQLIETAFTRERCHTTWGRLMFVGRPRNEGVAEIQKQ